MIFSGCQGKPQTKILYKKCPECGCEIEMMSTDTEVTCDQCGCTVYNDTLSCVRWCEHARECVGDTMYEYMMQKLSKQQNTLDIEALIAEAGEIKRPF